MNIKPAPEPWTLNVDYWSLIPEPYTKAQNSKAPGVAASGAPALLFDGSAPAAGGGTFQPQQVDS